MSDPKDLCRDCGGLAVLVQTKPERYSDGFSRCRPCMTARVAAIIEYWREAGRAYSTQSNRGGYA